ncbi:MAG TPA: hypothetical protein EYP07_05660 [Kiloniellaceae bacterium]|nr:hypothetical protein [Kiloniellaceae bacterium]
MQTMLALPQPIAYAPIAAGPEVSVSGALTALYFSDSSYTSAAADDPPIELFRPRLKEPYDFAARLFEQGEPAGRSSVSAGAISIVNADGALDELLGLGWAGRTIELYRGRRSAPFSSFNEVFRGTCDGITWTTRLITIRLRDRQDILAQPLQTALYGGAGGLDAGEDLAGKAKPQCYGQCFNVPPAAIDTARQVYQVHDREIEGILAVRDNGAALAPAGDVAALALADVFAWDPQPGDAGTYITDVSQGVFRLGSAPAGRVTADVLGDAFGGFVSTTADIVRRIVSTQPLVGQINDPAGLDVASFDALNAAQSAVVGFFASAEQQPSIAEVVDRLLAGIGGYWFFTRRDGLRVGRLEAPVAGGRVIEQGRIADTTPISRRLLQRPSRARRVAWAPLWAVQDPDSLADAVAEEDKEFYSTPARLAAASDDGVLTKHRLALDVEVPALFAFQSDAENEAERLLALHSQPRDVYTLGLVDSVFQFEIGDALTLALGRFGLDQGRPFVVLSVEENAARNETLLELWG